MNSILLVFLWHQDKHGKQAYKKTEVTLGLLTNFDKLLMVKKGHRGAICHVIDLQKLTTNA